MNSPLLTWWIELSKVAMQIAPYNTDVIYPKYYKNSMYQKNSAILLKYPTFEGVFFCVFMEKINTKVRISVHCSICTIKLQKNYQFWLKTVLFGVKIG